MGITIKCNYRTKKIGKPERQEGTDMNNRHKKAETFIIKIMDQQNATWQGSVTWVDEQRERYFRSALELLKLIDGALEKSNDEDNCDEENNDEDKRRTP